MNIIVDKINTSRSQACISNGYSIPTLISRAWNFNSITEDVFLLDEKGNIVPFVIIPLSEGKIEVELIGNEGVPFVISETEIKSSLGQPMLYFISRIRYRGTTMTSFNIGI